MNKAAIALGFQRLRAISIEDRLVAGWVLAIKLLLLFFGAKSFQMLEDKRPTGPHAWLEMWNRWDALHYQSIAQSGYATPPPVKLLFYPFYPWCVRVVAFAVGNTLVSAFLVTALASIAAAILLRRLIEFDYPGETALRAVWFFLIFPTAYFFHIGYTEALFLTLALAALFAARLDQWSLASILGALCWMTRPTGLVIIPTLIVEAAHQFWTTRKWNWQWLWIAIIPVGFVVYFLIQAHVTGDWFGFLRIRKSVFATTFGWPWTGIHNAIGNMRRAPNQAEMVGFQELFYVVLGFVCLVISWFKLRPSYAMWITGNWILVCSATFIESVPRYTLTFFPIFILFALLAQNRFWNGLITVWSILFLAVFTSLFVRGWWAF